MNSLEDVVVPVAIFGGFVWIVRIITDYLTRKRLIEKGLVDEKVKYLYHESGRHKALSNMKWGIVLIGIGLAAMFSFWWPDTFHEEGTIGLMFLFAGVGFLSYYFLAPKSTDNNHGSPAN